MKQLKNDWLPTLNSPLGNTAGRSLGKTTSEGSVSLHAMEKEAEPNLLPR